MHESWSMCHVILVLVLFLTGLLTFYNTQAFTEYEFDLPLYQQSAPWLVCPNGWTQIGISCVRVFTGKVSFPEAEIVCQSYGGHMIYIEGLNLNTLIGERAEGLQAGDAVWIGFKRNKNGVYLWNNGKTGSVYDGIWLLGQPNVYKNDLDLCVSMVTTGSAKFRWQLESCERQLGFVCASVSCVAEDFRCGDGKCITASWQCDGQIDCGDGSDEADCGPVSCGRTLLPPVYAFQSPRVGGTYQSWLKCQWKIQAPIGQKVKLQFLLLDTEEHHDVVSVLDGPLITDRVLGTFSGTSIPDPITSSTNFLLVTFTSDYSVEKQGFSASWEPVTSLCDTKLEAQSMVEWVASPGYPEKVEANSECSWLLNSDQLISIQILDLDLSEDDWLEVRDGGSGEATLLAHLEGKASDYVIISSGQQMFIELKTGLGQTGYGFNISYHSGCDVTLYNGYGTISSPGYSPGNQYLNNLDCTWTLLGAQQRELTLIFHHFDTETDGDPVLVYSSADISSKTLLANLSGPMGPGPLHSPSGQLVVHFKSDQKLTKSGWIASFSFDCHDNSALPTIASRSSSKASYTSSISYDCDTGYRLIGTQRRYCDMGGQWRTTPPTCKLITCDPPLPLKNGALVNITSRNYGGVVYYICNPGHHMVGDVRVTCLENGWSELPRCEALFCPKLRTVENGRIFTPWKYYIYARAEFICEEGFRLVGYMFSECRNGSAWTHPEPECVPIEVVSCPEVSVPHGSVDKFGPISVGDAVHVTCDTGYQLDSSHDTLTCIESGDFDGLVPICKDVDECKEDFDPCGSQHSCVNTDGSYWCSCATGYQHTTSSGHKCEDIDECSYEVDVCEEECQNTDGSFTCACKEGHRLYNGSQVQVLGNTVLVPGKSCYVLCPALQITNVKRLVYSTDPAPDGSYISSTTAWIQCPYGASLDGPSTVHCEITGEWSSYVSECNAVQCPGLPSIRSGTKSYNGRRFVGTFAEFSCYDGYSLHGNKHRFCQYDPDSEPQYFWTGHQPVCEAVDCGTPQEIPHSDVEYESSSYSMEAVYMCHTGYQLYGESARTCLKTGQWSQEQIFCIAETCSNPDIPLHGSVISEGDGVYILGSTVSFTCDKEGYKITDPGPMECVNPDWYQETVSTSLPVYAISVLLSLDGLVTDADKCSEYYSSQFSTLLESFVNGTITEVQTCYVASLMEISVIDEGVVVDSSETKITVNQTIMLSPYRTDLAIQVLQPCVENLWRRMTTASERSADLPLNGRDSCPEITVPRQRISIREPIEICISGFLVTDGNTKSCRLVNQGPVHMIHLGFQLTGQSLPSIQCLTELQSSLGTTMRMFEDNLGPSILCQNAAGIQLDKSPGSLTLETESISVGVNFFLYDHSVNSSDVNSCTETVRDRLVDLFAMSADGVIDGSDGSCMDITLDEDSIQISNVSQLCPHEFIFHAASGNCIFCPEPVTQDTSTSSVASSTPFSSMMTSTFRSTASAVTTVSTTSQMSPATSSTVEPKESTSLSTKETLPPTSTTIKSTSASSPPTFSTSPKTDTSASTKLESTSSSTVVTESSIATPTTSITIKSTTVESVTTPLSKATTVSSTTDTPSTTTGETETEKMTSKATSIKQTTDSSTSTIPLTTKISTGTVSTTSTKESPTSTKTSEVSSTVTMPMTSTTVATQSQPAATSTTSSTISSATSDLSSTSAAVSSASSSVVTSTLDTTTLPSSTLSTAASLTTPESSSSSSSTSPAASSPVASASISTTSAATSISKATSFSATSASSTSAATFMSMVTTSASASTSASTTPAATSVSPATSTIDSTSASATSSATSIPTATSTSSPVSASSASAVTSVSATTPSSNTPTTISATSAGTPISVSTTSTSTPTTITATSVATSISAASIPPSFSTTLLTTSAAITTSTIVAPTSTATTKQSTEASSSTTTTPQKTSMTSTKTIATTTAPETTPTVPLPACDNSTSESKIDIPTEFNYSVAQFLLFISGTLSSTTLDNFCVESYKQKLTSILLAREDDFINQDEVRKWCTLRGVFVKIKLLNLVSDTSAQKVEVTLEVSLVAMKDFDVNSDSISTCMGALASQYPDMTHASCLLRTELVIPDDSVCQSLSTVDVVLMIFDMRAFCPQGMILISNENTCIQDEKTTATTAATSATTATTTPTTTTAAPPMMMTCFECNQGNNNDDCIQEFVSCTMPDAVCQTEVKYRGRQLFYISKKCEQRDICKANADFHTQACNTKYNSPTCYYCCDTNNCNENVTLLQYETSGRRRRRSVTNTQPMWNMPVPQCVDIEPPIFLDCPRSINVSDSLLPKFVNVTMPTAKDNSGNLPTVTIAPMDVTMETTDDVISILVYETTAVTFIATDSTGNQAECIIQIHVIDTTPPKLLCPAEVVVITTPSEDQTTAISYGGLNLFVPSGITSVTYSPPGGEIIQVLQEINVTVTALDIVGNKAVCQFIMIVKPAGCPPWTIQAPPYVSLNCKWDKDTCAYSCWKNATMVVRKQEYTCIQHGQWSPTNVVNDCVPDEYMQCPEWTYRVRWTLLPESNVGVDSHQCNFLPDVTNKLQDLLAGIQNVSVTSTLDKQGKIYFDADFTIVSDSGIPGLLNCPDMLDLNDIDNLTITNNCQQQAKLINVTLTDHIQKTCQSSMVLIENDDSDGMCWPCPIGYEARTASCEPCQTGKYRDSIHQPQCVDCPPGTSTKGPYASKATDCRELCGKGEYSSTGVAPCNKCEYGQYQPKTGSTMCLNCGKGTNTTGMGSESLDECTLFCEPGEYSPTGLAPCYPCPTDTFSEASAATTCVSCHLGTMTMGSRSASADDCQAPTDHCAGVTCSANSQCVNDRETARCDCVEGFTGLSCETRINPCTDDPCSQGTCMPTSAGFKCQCDSGYTGELCEERLDPCLTSQCQYGQCIRNYTDHSHSCVCYSGFTGQDCSLNINDCVDHECKNGGVCHDMVNFYQCDCQHTNYHGTYCEIAEDRCLGWDCLNGGTCSDTGNDIICSCPSGFSGVYCELLVDECDSSPCQNDGQCIIAEDGNIMCVCKTGYSGVLCEEKSTACDVNPCGQEGQCMFVDDKYICSCNDGYSGVQCETWTSHCSSNPCNAATTVECVDKRNGYDCICRTGWTGQQCQNEIDQCDPSPCLNDGSCTQQENHYICTCLEGFSGRECQVNLDECTSKPCFNGGTCEDGINNYTCNCPSGFTGNTCHIEVDLCDKNPCQNGGTCIDNIDGFVCLCGDEWNGEKCTNRVDTCLTLPCMNDGVCEHMGDYYICHCPQNYTGQICELEIDVCDPNPCINGGSCTPSDGEYQCDCLVGFYGNQCETSDTCHCVNGGTCLYSGTDVMCQCPVKYKGPACEKEKSSSFDLRLTESGNQGCVVPVEEETADLSVCLWFRAPVSTLTGAFLIISEQSQALLTIQAEFVKIRGSKVLLGKADHVWHHLCVTWSLLTGDWVVYVDRETFSGQTLALEQALTKFTVEIGLFGDPEFAPVDISGLNIYSSIIKMDDLDLDTCHPISNHGNLKHWLDFEGCGGFVGNVVKPSACGTSTCAAGFRGENCDLHVDKELPKVESCPGPVQQTVLQDEFSSTVLWENPSFVDNQGIVDIRQTHQPGQTFAFGEHWVTYTAFDGENNHVTCTFRVFVTPMYCRLPDAPQNGDVACDSLGNSGTICTISCMDDSLYKFADTPAGFYACGQEGLWDPPLSKLLLFPPCAGFSVPYKKFEVDMSLTGPTCSDANKINLSNILRHHIEQTGVCNSIDCVAAKFDIDCVIRNVVKRSTQSVVYIVVINIPFYNLTQDKYSGIEDSFDSLLKADITGFTSLDLDVVVQRTCDSGQVLNSQDECVNCGKGYYHIKEIDHCELCPLGSYNDREKQRACRPCDEGQTTLTAGSSSQTQCFAVCDVGHYLLDEACEPCEVGTYQDTSGAISCKPCPFGQTTLDTGSASSSDCYVICGALGMELTVEGDCVPCAIGTYKADRSEVICQPCPYGYTTNTTGATNREMCTLVICKAGYWRTEENICETCRMGTYQSLEGQTVCDRCPTGQTTVSNASVDISQCVEGEVDECFIGTDDCHTTALCMDLQESYECSCETGFTMDNTGVCIDNCVGACDRGTCEKDANGVPACVCDDGYEGEQCDSKQATGLGTAGLIGICVAAVFVVTALGLVAFFCLRRYLLDKDGKPLLQFPIHRSDLRSSFRAFALAMNPRFDMSGERRAVIHQTRPKRRWTEHEIDHNGSNSGHSNTSYF